MACGDFLARSTMDRLVYGAKSRSTVQLLVHLQVYSQLCVIKQLKMLAGAAAVSSLQHLALKVAD